MWGSSCSIISSTGAPALIIIMMTRGRLTASTSSSIEWAGIKFFPLPRPFTKRSTIPSSPGKLRLYTATVKPLLSMFRARFSPITARPISPISAFFMFCSILYFVILSMQTNRSTIHSSKDAYKCYPSGMCNLFPPV